MHNSLLIRIHLKLYKGNIRNMGKRRYTKHGKKTNKICNTKKKKKTF